jgi:chromosome segregation ATPase
MEIMAKICQKILDDVQWRIFIDLHTENTIIRGLAQAWLDHEAQVATLTQALECERQATNDTQAVMERCEEENERLRAQMGELQEKYHIAAHLLETEQQENASLRAQIAEARAECE